MEHGSTMKNEIIPFAATWIDLAIIILSEVKSGRERQIPHDIVYMWTLKKKKKTTNEIIYKTEIDPQTWKAKLWLPKGKLWGEGKVRSLGLTVLL